MSLEAASGTGIPIKCHGDVVVNDLDHCSEVFDRLCSNSRSLRFPRLDTSGRQTAVNRMSVWPLYDPFWGTTTISKKLELDTVGDINGKFTMVWYWKPFHQTYQCNPMHWLQARVRDGNLGCHWRHPNRLRNVGRVGSGIQAFFTHSWQQKTPTEMHCANRMDMSITAKTALKLSGNWINWLPWSKSNLQLTPAPAKALMV